MPMPRIGSDGPRPMLQLTVVCFCTYPPCHRSLLPPCRIKLTTAEAMMVNPRGVEVPHQRTVVSMDRFVKTMVGMQDERRVSRVVPFSCACACWQRTNVSATDCILSTCRPNRKSLHVRLRGLRPSSRGGRAGSRWLVHLSSRALQLFQACTLPISQQLLPPSKNYVPVLAKSP